MINQETVHKFMQLCGQTDTGFGPQSDLYLKLIKEEGTELINGIRNKDLVEIADGIIDTIVVCFGMLYTIQTPSYCQERYDWESIKSLDYILPDSHEVIKNPVEAFELDLRIIQSSYRQLINNQNNNNFYVEFLEDIYYLIENCVILGLNLNLPFNLPTLEKFKILIGE